MQIKKISILLSIILLILMVLSSCLRSTDPNKNIVEETTKQEETTNLVDTEKEETTAAETTHEAEEPQKSGNGKLSFAGVGDNIIYFGTYRDAAAQSNGSRQYNFAPIYQYVASAIQSADVAFINQETPVSQSNDVESYPTFNSPVDLTYDVADAGFDIINLANNHMLDQGAQGLKESYENWKARGLTVIGCYEESDQKYITYYEKNGITIGFVSYTYGTNLNQDPATVGLYAPYLKQSDVSGDIKEAKKNSDVVIVSVHWGDEGAMQPNEEQKKYANIMAEAGADVILGHHPHVIEPIEWIETNSGKTLCVYSLGNFVHEQAYDYNVPGGIINFDIVKNKGKTTIENVEFVPTICHYPANFYNNVVYFFKDYTQTLASQHAVATYYQNSISYDSLKNYITNTISSDFLPDYLK